MELKYINKEEAFRYMGYKGGDISPQILKLADECEKALLEAIKPRYIYKLFDIEPIENGIGIKNTTLVLSGKDIVKHLNGCQRCILMCATISNDADRLIRTYEAEDMTKAFIADSLASAAVEQVCNQAEEEIKAKLVGYNFTWRFSPGYGDLPIEIQPQFVEVLDAPKRIGVNVSESTTLVPRKSVTAIIGISENEISKGRRGCVCCNMRDRCEFRRRGERCGF